VVVGYTIWTQFWHNAHCFHKGYTFPTHLRPRRACSVVVCAVADCILLRVLGQNPKFFFSWWKLIAHGREKKIRFDVVVTLCYLHFFSEGCLKVLRRGRV
jgi:hypothetical protein